MPTNLSSSTIASTFDQLLHVDDGPTATEKTVYGGTGVATALKVGTTSASVGNVQLTGNTVQATTGSLTLGSDIAFGSASNARTALGLGTMATQNSGAIAITGGTLSGVTITGSFSGLTLVESVTMATGNAAAGCNLNGSTLAADGTDANIDLNITPKGTGRTVVGALSATSPRVVTGVNDTNGNELLKVTATASAVNELTLANAATGNGPTLSATGDDTNIDINITPKGTGIVKGTRLLATSSIGYTTGLGGAVTQGTSRTTGVTLNAPSGQITLFAANLAVHDADEFTLTNSFIAATDIIVVNIASGAAVGTRRYYHVGVVAVAAGSCVISVGNIRNAVTPPTGTESPVLTFAIIKGVIA
jgi:hypothetical protein